MHFGRTEYVGVPLEYSVTTNDWITANPILEMRTALDLALGAPSPSYDVSLAQDEPIKAIHIQELRDRVLAAWANGSSTQINWLVADHLGTPRMIFDQTGSLANVSRHDYLPFGEELTTQGLRPSVQGYTNSDGARQKFTLKERDNETGLDYFGARYYGSTQGRFTSADAPFMDQHEYDPQSWNLYSYVGNNPLLFTDPMGLWKWVDADNNGQRFLQWEENDDWKTLSAFLEKETGRYYSSPSLGDAFGSGGLGPDTIVDLTGAHPSFNPPGGLKDTSWDVVLTAAPLGRGAKTVGGMIKGAWRGDRWTLRKESRSRERPGYGAES